MCWGKQKLTQSCVCFAAEKREQSQEDGQIVKLSRLNGMMKAEEKEERGDLITAALREALTKRGKEQTCSAHHNHYRNIVKVM